MRWQETCCHTKCNYGRKYPLWPTWRCKRLRTRPKYWIISFFKCNWNLHNWHGAGSEPWVILRLFLIFQNSSLMILIKRILIKKKACNSCKISWYFPAPKSIKQMLYNIYFPKLPIKISREIYLNFCYKLLQQNNKFCISDYFLLLHKPHVMSRVFPHSLLFLFLPARSFLGVNCKENTVESKRSNNVRLLLISESPSNQILNLTRISDCWKLLNHQIQAGA